MATPVRLGRIVLRIATLTVNGALLPFFNAASEVLDLLEGVLRAILVFDLTVTMTRRVNSGELRF